MSLSAAPCRKTVLDSHPRASSSKADQTTDHEGGDDERHGADTFGSTPSLPVGPHFTHPIRGRWCENLIHGQDLLGSGTATIPGNDPPEDNLIARGTARYCTLVACMDPFGWLTLT
jgi:hypothetical protein